jgi:hypothetical protein
MLRISSSLPWPCSQRAKRIDLRKEMTLSSNKIARIALIGLAGLGMLAGAKLSLEHLQHGEVCPMLGPIPACIIVFLGYLGVVLAAFFIKQPFSKKLFYVGWTPVFFLALIGVGLELTKGHVCPPGAMGIPQCFFSLAMALICFGLFKFSPKTEPSS